MRRKLSKQTHDQPLDELCSKEATEERKYNLRFEYGGNIREN